MQASAQGFEPRLAPHYFATVGAVTQALIELMATEAPGAPGAHNATGIVQEYLRQLAHSLECFRLRNAMTGRVPEHYWPSEFSVYNGLPVSQQWLELAGDFDVAQASLANSDTVAELEEKILDHCLNQRSLPRELQFRLSQRLYREALTLKPCFLPRNTPQLTLVSKTQTVPRRYLLHWAVFDSERNLPNLYFSLIEESGAVPLHEDERRWHAYREALLNQSLSSLTLLTIAHGLDEDFPDIHPLTLRRIHAGPLYLHEFTSHSDAIHRVLAEQAGRPGQDWVFEWTVETLVSKDSRQVSRGLFRSGRRETYHIDAYRPDLVSAGASSIDRYMIMPIGPYQSMRSLNDERLNAMTKYVVGPEGSLLHRIQ
ncbi:hypothetical protein [Saccharospirillum alexandrii]|uniref:hypothetical protein n=1 Tax=Saccharospirillum alexandrii TaxID=2448477 RepID=UPI003736C707